MRITQEIIERIDDSLFSSETSMDLDFIIDDDREIIMVYEDRSLVGAYATDPTIGDLFVYAFDTMTKQKVTVAFDYVLFHLNIIQPELLLLMDIPYESISIRDGIYVSEIDFDDDTLFSEHVFGIMVPSYEVFDPYEGASLEYQMEFLNDGLILTLTGDHLPIITSLERYMVVSAIITYDYSDNITIDDTFISSEDFLMLIQ